MSSSRSSSLDYFRRNLKHDCCHPSLSFCACTAAVKALNRDGRDVNRPPLGAPRATYPTCSSNKHTVQLRAIPSLPYLTRRWVLGCIHIPRDHSPAGCSGQTSAKISFRTLRPRHELDARGNHNRPQLSGQLIIPSPSGSCNRWLCRLIQPLRCAGTPSISAWSGTSPRLRGPGPNKGTASNRGAAGDRGRVLK